MDQDPMIEVVRDTVGRHDTFNLACTSKYYEDAGYFGHANCSDNFNQALKPFGVNERRGWQAINLFFNTFTKNLNQNHTWFDCQTLNNYLQGQGPKHQFIQDLNI